jgi:hypothetical protein
LQQVNLQLLNHVADVPFDREGDAEGVRHRARVRPSAVI